jgi:hypothetical protein
MYFAEELKVPVYFAFIITVVMGNSHTVSTHLLLLPGSRVSSGSIVSDYGLDDQAIEVRSLAGAKDFSSNLCVQTGSGAHPASCTMGTGGKAHSLTNHSPPLVPRS